MTREDLYKLVWSEPISKLAPRYGISDVGLRKICVKHSIPTPPVGYWQKLQFGKKVEMEPLLPLKGGAQIVFRLAEVSQEDVPVSIKEASEAALDFEARLEQQIVVPEKMPGKLHSHVVETARALRKSKADHNGFILCKGRGLIETQISPASIDRVSRIYHAILSAADERNYQVDDVEGGIAIIVAGEPFSPSLHETSDKVAHQPTVADLKKQAEYDLSSKRYPSLYRAGVQQWPQWDHFPSGRLSLHFFNPTRWRWRNEDWLAGRWHDRKMKPLELQLNNIFASLVTTSAITKVRRAEEAEKKEQDRRIAELRERQLARKARVNKRYDFLQEKALELTQLVRMKKLRIHWERAATDATDEASSILISELDIIIEGLEERLDPDQIGKTAIRSGLVAEDDFEYSDSEK